MFSPFKLFAGFFKFYFVLTVFGMLANVITYISADILYYLENQTSLLVIFFTQPESVSDAYGLEAVSYFMRTAFESVPGDAYFEDALGLFIEGANGNIFTFMGNVLGHKDAVQSLKLSFADYAPLFLRDMAVATLATFVFFATSDVKDKIIKKSSLSSFLGFVCAAFFWMLAGYTFGRCVVTVLERRVSIGNHGVLYVIIIIVAVALEALVHAYAKKNFVWRLLLASAFKMFFAVIKAFLAWLMCTCYPHIVNPTVIPSLIFLSLLFIAFTTAEMKATRWAERKHAKT